MRIHLGIDDTDSLSGGCTTKIATDLVAALASKGVEFLDYPNLIRLNPNVPWKTRGNGAVCLRIESGSNSEEIFELAVKEIERSSRLADPGTDPGLVIVQDPVPTSVTKFAAEALTRIVSLVEAISVIRAAKAEAMGFGSGQGIIGALAATGTDLNRDHTFELIAYRSKHNIGRPRCIDSSSVFQMNEETKHVTFNNIDPESQRILITPRGPDPILCGVRGETPETVRNAFRMLRIGEPVDAWMIFRTNQGTDAHLSRRYAISGLQDDCAVVVEATVKMIPLTIPGGHVIFVLEDQTGQVHCAAYEPTGRFREIVKRLEPGDRVRAFGGVRAPENSVPRTLNLEKLEILSLVPRLTMQNPVCESCGRRMKSAGKEQGFRCKRCKNRASSKIQIETPRELEERLYLPPPRAHRHLTKPEVRYGREHSGTSTRPALDWHFP